MQNNITTIGKRYLDWLVYGRFRPVTDQTLRTYRDHIKIIARQFGNCSVLEIDVEKVKTLKRNMMDRNLTSGYIHRSLCFIRAFLRYCQEQEGLDVLDRHKIVLPPEDRSEVECNTQEELNLLFNLIKKNTVQDLRLLAFVAIALDTAARLNEILDLDRDSIKYFFDENGIRTGRAQITGKGRKKREIMFNDWSLICIEKYLSLRTDSHQALFVTHDLLTPTTRLTDSLVQRYFARLSRKATGKAGLFASHKLRRTASNNSYENGMDLFSLRDYLGHSDVRVTQRYVAKNKTHLRAAHQKFVSYGGLENKFVEALNTYRMIDNVRS